MCPMSFLFSSPFFIHLPLSHSPSLFRRVWQMICHTLRATLFTIFPIKRFTFLSFFLALIHCTFCFCFCLSPVDIIIGGDSLSFHIRFLFMNKETEFPSSQKHFERDFFAVVLLLSYSISTTLPFWSCYIFPCASTKCYSSISAQPVLMTIAFTLTKYTHRRKKQREGVREMANKS